jgi:hypothetical protein
MTLKERIELFSELGSIIIDSVQNGKGDYSGKLNELIEKQQFINSWFTPEYVRTALLSIATELNTQYLTRWTGAYPFSENTANPFKVGLIFAGNIPLAGFHDFLSVLISGNNLIAKTSTKDPDLIPFLGEVLCSLDTRFNKAIVFTEGTLSGFDAVIATGSNNSSRYFEYYFGKYPHIIRKNRNSIAVITGEETESELEDLGKDIFTYFGLGCRNVSKIYVPEDYDVSALAGKWEAYSNCINHSKYANNYDYNKAIYLVNKQAFIDTGFLLVKEDANLSSPVSVLNFEYYRSEEKLKEKTGILSDKIQCIVGRENIPFGQAQLPHLWDYADGIDTLDFMLKNNSAGIL